MKKRHKTTSMDIAYFAGVSQSTVSRALSGSGPVNAETRERVKAVARRFNYRVDRSAASLRKQSSRTLALLLFEDRTGADAPINPFFLNLLGSVTRAASEAGYDLLLSFQDASADWQVDYEMANRADGLVLLGYGDYQSYTRRLAQLDASKANYIIWGPVNESGASHSVGCDNVRGAWEAARHLLALGRREIAFIGDIGAGCPEFKLRHEGYLKAHAESGLPANPRLQYNALNEVASAEQALARLIDSGHSFDAIMTASDLMAMAVINRLKALGHRVPEDYAVVGFDDLPTSAYLDPPLTTVHQDTGLAGWQLVDKLIKIINGEPVSSTLIAPSLKIRASCGAKLGKPSASVPVKLQKPATSASR